VQFPSSKRFSKASLAALEKQCSERTETWGTLLKPTQKLQRGYDDCSLGESELAESQKLYQGTLSTHWGESSDRSSWASSHSLEFPPGFPKASHGKSKTDEVLSLSAIASQNHNDTQNEVEDNLRSDPEEEAFEEQTFPFSLPTSYKKKYNDAIKDKKALIRGQIEFRLQLAVSLFEVLDADSGSSIASDVKDQLSRMRRHVKSEIAGQITSELITKRREWSGDMMPEGHERYKYELLPAILPESAKKGISSSVGSLRQSKKATKKTSIPQSEEILTQSDKRLILHDKSSQESQPESFDLKLIDVKTVDFSSLKNYPFSRSSSELYLFQRLEHSNSFGMDSAIETSSSTSNSIINSTSSSTSSAIQTFPRPGRKKRTGFFQIYELPRIRYRGPSNKLNELSLVSKNGDYDVKDYDRKNAIRSSIVPNSTVHELSDVIFDLEATHLHEAVNNYLSAGSERISSALESAGPYEIDMVQVWRTVFIHSFVGRAQRDSQTATNSTKIVATSDDATSTTTYAKSHDALQRLWKLLKQRKKHNI
jgi:hypothetical protein